MKACCNKIKEKFINPIGTCNVSIQNIINNKFMIISKTKVAMTHIDEPSKQFEHINDIETDK